MKVKLNQIPSFRVFAICIVVALIVLTTPLYGQDTSKTVNDISQLNPVKVSEVISPTTTQEIIKAIKTHTGPISIGGGRYSMGGQTATENALQIDMRRYDSILAFSLSNKEITVQSGITWRKIQEFIDPFNLSVKIMQTYANFTVGGSLSVNVHGRYIGEGPIILSIKQIKIILANGELLTASPTVNSDIFYGAIGGYGGLGVIAQATLLLTDNVKVERTNKVMAIKEYKPFFLNNIKDDTAIIFHNADWYPNRYKKVREISYRKTQRQVTVSYRLKPNNRKYRFNKFSLKIISASPVGKWLRQHLLDPVLYARKPVEWRNFEASYDLLELEPKSRKKSTYVLQEYFVPVNRFDTFYPLLAHIFKANKVNVINVSIRHANQDTGSMLAWAKTEVFAFVVYYKQRTDLQARADVKQWTQQIIDAAIACKGSYYLPYQINATSNQFLSAYPNAVRYFALKMKVDPTNKFRNKLWDTYYK